MSACESSDSEKGSMSDWAIVSANMDDCIETESTGRLSADLVLESKIQDIEEPELKKSDGSDFECIPEDGTEENIIDKESFENSQTSHFSYIQNKECFEHDKLSTDGSSGFSLVADDENTDLSSFPSLKDYLLPNELSVQRQRSYTHTPNSRLNIVLTGILILSFTLVCGLGIGHFLGWSSRWSHQYRLHQTHVIKLKALQEELVNCLQTKEDNSLQLQVCYEKVDSWKKIFDDILSQNQQLHDFVDKNKLNIEIDDDDDDKCDEVNKSMINEYKQLKFHLISQQLENMETLKKMEDIKKQEMETLYRVKKLEEENEELKAFIEMEDGKPESEQAANSTEELLIKQLEYENEELKKEVANLKITLQLEEDEDNQTVKEIGSLRQQINKLLTENSDLQRVIAKLHYSQPYEEPASKEEEGKDSWIESTGWLDLHLNNFIDHLMKIATDKNTAKQELNILKENIQNGYKELSKKAKESLVTGKDMFNHVHKELESKINAIINANLSSTGLTTEAIQALGKTLGNAVQTLYDGLFAEEQTEQKDRTSPEKGKSRVEKFHEKIEKVLITLEEKWESVWHTIWMKKTPNEHVKSRTTEVNPKQNSAKTESHYVSDFQAVKDESSSSSPPIAAAEASLKQSMEKIEHPKVKICTEKTEHSKVQKSKEKSTENQKVPKHKGKNTEKTEHQKVPKCKEKRMERAEHLKVSKCKEKRMERAEHLKVPKCKEESREKAKQPKVQKLKKKGKSADEEVKQSGNRKQNRSKKDHQKFEKNSTRHSKPKVGEQSKVPDPLGNKNWMFERAANREKFRTEILGKQNWYFERPKHKQFLSSDKNDEKKMKKHKKHDDGDDDDDEDDSSDEDSDDDEDWRGKKIPRKLKSVHKRRERFQKDWKKHNKEQHIKWQVPNPLHFSY